MTNIYRRPKVHSRQMKFQRGKLDGGIDGLLYYGDDIPRCDRSLVMSHFGSERMTVDMTKGSRGFKFQRSFIEELEIRGYDIDTLRFSIEKKAVKDE